jgi:hypothetical protein
MGKRKLITDPIYANDLQALSDAILAYVDEGVRLQHANAHNWHHAGDPAFFEGHRQFIGKLEAVLASQGLGRLVPLPKWDPRTTIPAPFRAVKMLPAVVSLGLPSTISNPSPDLPPPASVQDLSVFATAADLSADADLQNWHANVHVAVGGAMAFLSVSPCAASFWLWHAFIDDIYEDWIALQALPAVGDVLHFMTANTDGTLWHAIRIADGRWSPFGDVEGQIGDSGSYLGLGAGGDSGAVQFAMGEVTGGLFHTIRNVDGSWSGVGDVKGQTGDRGHTVDTCCAVAQGQLQLLQVTSDGNLWHALRLVDGSWTGLGDVKGQAGNPGPIARGSCALESGNLHVVACTPAGAWVHTIRDAAGAWTGFGDIKGQTGDPGPVVDVAAAQVKDEVHVLAVTSDGRLWHAIRRSDGSWTGVGDVKGQIGDPGHIQRCAAAAIGPELHIGCLTSNGGVWHSIRHADGSWQPVGDVESQTGDRGSGSDLALASAFVP